jgi:predicted membrane channel-forming protein YqfA (hemolysin III family)
MRGVDYMLASMTRRSWIALAATIAGIALLVWQVRTAGIDRIGMGIASVGLYGFAGILVISLLRFLARSTAWTALIAAESPPGRALAAVIAGDAVGQLTPLSLLVSEPAKAAYLGSAMPTVGIAGALAALVAETFFFSVSVAMYIFLGAAMLLVAYPLEPTLRTAGLAALGAMVLFLITATWMAWRKPTLAGAIFARLHIRQITELADTVRAFERTAYRATGHTSARLGIVIASEAAFHVLSFAEMWLTLWLITGESNPAAAFILDTVGRLTNIMFKMVPLQLGVLQVGSELVARALGLPPGIGTTASLIRTIRLLTWTVIGFGLALQKGLQRPAQPI